MLFLAIAFFIVLGECLQHCSVCHRDNSFEQCLLLKRTENIDCSLKDVCYSDLPTIHVTVYGNLHEYAYYYCIIEIGTPVQEQVVVIDTGSPNLVLSSSLCVQCGHHEKPPLNPSLSRTLSLVDGIKSFCANPSTIPGKRRHCKFEQTYEEGSTVNGYYANDYFTFRSENEPDALYKLRNIGLITLETGPINEQRANGILGLGLMSLITANEETTERGSNNYGNQCCNGHVGSPASVRSRRFINSKNDKISGKISQDNLRKYSGVVSNDMVPFTLDYLRGHFRPERHVFSLCLSENGGSLTFGGYSRHYATRTSKNNRMKNVRYSQKSITWVPLSVDDGYVIKVDSIIFSGMTIDNGNRNFYLDSGSTNSLLQSSTHSKIHSFFVDLCALLEQNEVLDQKSMLKAQYNLKGPDANNYVFPIINDIEKKISGKHTGRVPISESMGTESDTYSNPSETNEAIQPVRATTTKDKHVSESLYLDSLNELYKNLSGETTCSISHTTGYLCFSNISKMPTIRLKLESGEVLHWKPKSYFIRRRRAKETTNKAWWCLGLENGDNNNILGATFFKNNLVVFDLNRGKLGKMT
ncbi:aspartic peptidase A1 like protein [Babesia gibsoni]|uniref:Aspartic peptidase A1 like protein n=1 Tax=Babesia gibsoni TaxID=33632 RepID=A0AAD8PFD9_BABGI|nr:aspartic peptidase A1 like protein [Babesia gibsoni]